ncbi:MAG TPA: MFS transporter, partial [Dongiaceae bacterium]|nr:MFS transporter [Dongiaceae bacterium]
PAAVLPAIIATLHITDGQAGSLQTLFIYTYSVVSLAAGWLGDRYPRFRLAAIGVFVWSVATFGSGLAPTFALLMAARALTGVGEASYTVVTPSLLSDFYPADRRGRVLAIFYAAIPVGSAVSYILSGQIEKHLGWRWAFFVAGVPGIVLAMALLFLRDPPRGALDPVLSHRPAPLPGGGRPSLRASLHELFRRPSFIYNTAGQTIYTFVIGGLATWMPTYFVRVRHLPLAEADRSFGIVLLLAGFLGTLAGGRLGDRLAARRADGHFLISGWALVASLPFTLLALLSPTPAIFWPSMFVTLALLFLNTGPLNAAMANVLPASVRGIGFAVNTAAIHVLGDGASPKLIGMASDRFGLAMPVLITGSILVLAGIVLLAGRRALVRDLEEAAAA